jgi:hypothetical protein
MKIKITKPGIYGAAGEIAVGTELDVKDEPKGWAGRYEVISGGSSDGKTAVLNPAEGGEGPKGPLEARDTGSGWWTIFDMDGKQVGKKLREDDAKAFNDLSDEDKVEFVKAEA